MPSAGDQLLGLDKEFDLANATPSELYVVAFDGDFAMTSIGMDLPLHFMNIRNRGVIEIFAPDEWRQIAEKLFAGADVAGASARLDQRRALPVLAAALVIVEHGGGRNCNLGRRGIRPQSQIDAEYVSIGGTRLQDFDQIARHANEEQCRLHIVCKAHTGVEENHEIDVARKIELTGSHFAHCDHDVAAAGLRIVRVSGLELFLAHRVLKQVVYSERHRNIGHARERLG